MQAPPKPLKTSKQTAPKSRVVSSTKKKATKVLKEIDENEATDRLNVDPEPISDLEPSSSDKIALQAKGKDKTATEMYQKVLLGTFHPHRLLTNSSGNQLTQLEHILKRPDSYIGSVEAHTQPMWIYDSENNRMTNR